MFFKKRKYMFLICIILLVILAYVTNITNIPKSLILFQNQKIDISPIFGVKLEESIPVGAEIVSENQQKQTKKEYNLSMLGINLKKITADIIPTIKVVPLGNLIGLKLNTKGVLVVGTSEIKGEDNKIYKPYEEAGINQGDLIIQINGEEVETADELIACVSKCKGNKIDIKYESNGEILNTTMKPVKTSEKVYKIGLWVRDAAAGVGTATFYCPSTKSVATLGHGIQDIDTGELIDISSGEFVTSEIIGIKKGEKENPGKIEGTIENSTMIGNIYTNTNFGVYGKYDDITKLNISEQDVIEVAARNEIKIGKASIICTLEDNIRREFEVEIEKVYVNNNENNKSMVVKVTDKELLKKTGGIIQGMSGSPVIQNGKLIGALTHVLVSSPDTGYAVFADMMVKEMKEVD